MRINRSTLVAAVAVFALLAAACGDDDATDTTAATTAATTTTAAPSTTAGTDAPTTTAGTAAPTTTTTQPGDAFQAEWDALVAAAQAEGELVMVVSTNNAGSQTAIYDRFGETFGINMVYAVGSTSEMNSRVLAERSQGVYSVDIAVMGTSAMTGFMEGQALQPLMPLLIDPSIQDRSLWHLEEFPWVRTDATKEFVSEYLLRNEPNVVRTYINTAVITPEVLAGINSFMDFVTDPRWQGRIVTANFTDETSDGTNTSLAWMWLAYDGPDFLEAFLTQNPPDIVPTGAARLIVDGIARGDWDVCFFCDIVTADATQAEEDGLPIAQLAKSLSEGASTDLTGHFGVFDQAANPNAAKLFVNWILSQEGQAAVNELIDTSIAVGVTALRKDVPQGVIDDDIWAVVSNPDYVPNIPTSEELDEAAVLAHEFVVMRAAELGLTPGA